MGRSLPDLDSSFIKFLRSFLHLRTFTYIYVIIHVDVYVIYLAKSEKTLQNPGFENGFSKAQAQGLPFRLRQGKSKMPHLV